MLEQTVTITGLKYQHSVLEQTVTITGLKYQHNVLEQTVIITGLKYQHSAIEQTVTITQFRIFLSSRPLVKQTKIKIHKKIVSLSVVLCCVGMKTCLSD